MLAVPLLTPRLSSHWLVPGHRRRHRNRPQPRRLDEQRGGRQRRLDQPTSFPAEPMGYDDAVRAGTTAACQATAASMTVADEIAARRRAWLIGRAAGLVRPVLIDKVERDHRQSDAAFLRRRIVVGITLAVGATLLGFSFSVRQGDPAFYPLTFGLAATWALGSLLSGPLHLGHILRGGTLRRPIITPIVVGLLLAAIFVVGAFDHPHDPRAREPH